MFPFRGKKWLEPSLCIQRWSHNQCVDEHNRVAIISISSESIQVVHSRLTQIDRNIMVKFHMKIMEGWTPNKSLQGDFKKITAGPIQHVFNHIEKWLGERLSPPGRPRTHLPRSYLLACLATSTPKRVHWMYSQVTHKIIVMDIYETTSYKEMVTTIGFICCVNLSLTCNIIA